MIKERFLTSRPNGDLSKAILRSRIILKMVKIEQFKASTLEMLANAIADIDPGITGSVIHKMLLQSQIEDISFNEQFLAKRKKLFNAFADYQNKNHCANNIILFIQNILSPQRYINNVEMFNSIKAEVNKQLAFEGLYVDDTNQIISVAKASKISDVQIKVDGLKAKLIEQGAHQLVFSYCNAELLANNYFHSVLESSKGLIKRIQDIAGVSYDGQNLIEKVFKDDEPILIVNNFQSKSEKDEHRGFRNLLIGIVAMFRNPTSHELKVEWSMSEQDALDILAMISYCHRKLDNAQKIRLE